VQFNPVDYLPVYRALEQSGHQLVIVGGQACSLWAESYGMNSFKPYTTKDLDFCTKSKQEVSLFAKSLKVEAVFPTKKNSPTHDIGVIEVPTKSGSLIIQFIRSTAKFSLDEIVERRQGIRVYGLLFDIWVMHPLQCMEDKMDSLLRFDQEDRQDEKHLRMSLEFVPQFIAERLFEGHCAAVLSMCQHVLELSKSKSGKRIRQIHKINVIDAIPTAALCAHDDSKIKNFVTMQLARETAVKP